MKDGQEKTYWANVGTITKFTKEDGSASFIVEIPAIGLKAQAFPMKKREDEPQATGGSSVKTKDDPIEYPSEEVNPNDIPF